MTANADPNAIPETALYQGAAAFHELLEKVRVIYDKQDLPLAPGHEINRDADYVPIVEAIDACVQTNLNNSTGAHREGFLRAIAAFFGVHVSGFMPTPGFDVIEETAKSYECRWSPSQPEEAMQS